MSYTHHIVGRIDNQGDTTYLHVSGSWHQHPSEATPFYDPGMCGAALEWIRRDSVRLATFRLEVFKVVSTVEPLQRSCLFSEVVPLDRKG